MKKEEILEGNKLIANFIGRGFVFEKLEGDNTIDVRIALLWEENCQFHSSYDWLMPVIQKIQGECGCRFYLFANEEHAEVRFTDMSIPGRELISVKDYTYCNLIEPLWRAVVNFIDWYNKQEK